MKMQEKFQRIILDRGWISPEAEKMLQNIENRLKKRLPGSKTPDLTRLQEKAIAAPNFWRDWKKADAPEHLMIQGATSAGKTLLSELNIIDTLINGHKAIVLVPLKAMVNERMNQFRKDMTDGLGEGGKKVFGSSSDYMDNDEQLIHGDFDVAIIVYEKFFAMLNEERAKIMDDCALLVVDELSMLSSEQRGAKLEMALEIVRRKYPAARIMCLATSDCDTEKVCKWLEIKDPIISRARPIALEEHILELNGRGIYRVIPEDHEGLPGDGELERHEEEIEIRNYRSDQRTEEKVRQLLLLVISKIFRETPDSRVLVFVPTRSRASSIASFLMESASIWAPRDDGSQHDTENYQKFLDALNSCERDEEQEKLIHDLIPKGIAFHHAGISTALRELIEGQFSEAESNLRVIVATETLTVGVNMPFDAMIILSSKVPRGMGELMPLTKQEYRNYIGRAGRLGQSNRIGKSYLFVERAAERDMYWRSYLDRDEVVSALTEADSENLAPFFLGMLKNRLGNISKLDTTFTPDDIKVLFNYSLLKICGNKKFDAEELCAHLYKGYLANMVTASGAVPRGESRAGKYKLGNFGNTIAPYALSIDTCIKIYCYFYEGYNFNGLPLGITQQDIVSDRYLLDILYHVCCHKEVAVSSTLTYFAGTQDSYKAKPRILTQLRDILSQKDEYGNDKYSLWYDGEGDDNGIWMLLHRTNLSDENLVLQAAMRAVVLFYWTKGYSTKEINKKTKFNSFTNVTSGDIERLAEVVSFHLDAIYKCLGTAGDGEAKQSVLQGEAYSAFYALQTRVKYGMPRRLVVFANKHIHGLDRIHLLKLDKEAEKMGLTPIQYLYLMSPGNVPKEILTEQQHRDLQQAIERRGFVGSIDTILEILANDAGSDLEEDQLYRLKEIASWGNDGETDPTASDDLYRKLTGFRRNNSAFSAVELFSDGRSCKIVWRTVDVTVHIGVLNSDGEDSDIEEFFEDHSFPRILLAPSNFDDKQMKDVFRRYNPDALFDNIYFTFALVKAVRIPIDGGKALTKMFADLRGIFTKFDFLHLPLLRYLEKEKKTSPKFRLIYGNQIERRFENSLTENDLEFALKESADLNEFEVLPWGKSLAVQTYDFSECPTVILLNRKDVVRSQSLTDLIYIMRNQNQFRNCILLLESESAENDWNNRDRLEAYGDNSWSDQFNRIRKKIVKDTPEAIRAIRSFVTGWRSTDFLIGISYSHYDPKVGGDESEWESDVGLLKRLALKLAGEYGEDRILFDQFTRANKLFDDNRGEEKSLDAYRKCRYYLILWNLYTSVNDNCKREREVIFDRCHDDTCKCMFLHTNRPNDPEVPRPDFARILSEANLDQIFERIKELIEGLNESSAE